MAEQPKADEKAPTPRAITYKEVKKASETGSLDNWRKIGEITGAGHVPLNADDDASIDLTDLPDSDMKRIDKLLADVKAAKSQKEGAK